MLEGNLKVRCFALQAYSVQFTSGVSAIHPGTRLAFLILQVPANPAQNPALQARKQQLAAELQARYPDKETIVQAPVIQAYQQYYQQFKSNYHVRFQLESVVIKGKALPERSLLVDAMFMAELQHGVLIAGHDLQSVSFPLTVDCILEGEQYTLLSAEIKAAKANDLCIRDHEKILSTILYGPDLSSPITADTRQALYTIYGPAGVPIETLSAALDDIQAIVQSMLPETQCLWKDVLHTD
jgi:DNA/RNA-binding domain of Phe-tRNA-synthetase-like protein